MKKYTYKKIKEKVDVFQKKILEKFEIDVAGCVRYVENDSQWREEILAILERL